MTQLEAETLALRSIVGALDVDPHGARALLDQSGLAVEDFTTKPTQALYAAIAGLARDGKRLEVMAFLSATKANAPKDLALTVTSGDRPDFAADRVATLRDRARRRRLRDSLKGLLGIVESGVSTDSCMGEVERVLRQLGAETTTGATSLDGSVMELVERLEAVQFGKVDAVLQTGIEALDYAIGGLQPTLTIIGALPAVGKSALLASIARNIAARGVPVGVVSLEDERSWLTERVTSEAASVPLFVLGNKPLARAQMERINDTINGVHAVLKNILVEDRPGMTTSDVLASARSMVARGCKAILVDHLGEIRLERSDRHDLDILEALQDLRGIAKTYRVPVVVACHLKRRDGLEAKSVPRLTDFAFSAAIERCARVALGLFSPPAENGGAEYLGIEVLKQTKGPAGFNFKIERARLSGTLLQTAPTKAMREKFGDWRDEA